MIRSVPLFLGKIQSISEKSVWHGGDQIGKGIMEQKGDHRVDSCSKDTGPSLGWAALF